MFRVGQKVVRVGSKSVGAVLDASRIGHFTVPAIGEVCTVSTINEWSYGTLITLCEHDNSHLIAELGCRYEPGFNAEAFRPVVERKTDISVFQAILRKATKKKRAPVERFPSDAWNG